MTIVRSTILTLLGLCSLPCQADVPVTHKPLTFRYLHVDGNIRSYYFTRDYSLHTVPDQRAFSLGGKINALTDSLWGFRAGATGYTAQPLGLNPEDIREVDRSLPGNSVTVFGQAFGQYENSDFFMRVGNQLITTPWMNEADSRMIPAAYQGIFVKATAIKNLDLIGMRITRFKSRISSNFSRTNNFTPSNLATPVIALADTTVNGALAFGGKYKCNALNVQAWAYQFYDFAKLFYVDANYVVPTGTFIKPILAAQIASEGNDGSHLLQKAGRGETDATLIGLLVGAEIADGSLTVGLNKIPQKRGKYLNGDVVSPYTSTSDPLYTTSMIAGLIEKASGSALKISAQYGFFTKKLNILASYAKYNTNPFIPNTSEEDFDVTYKPDGDFKGLSLRYRIGVLHGNPALGRFIYSRVMFQYDFG